MVDPGDLLDNLREISLRVQSVVVFVFVQHFHLEFVDVKQHLSKELRLVLGDSTSNFGAHEQFIVNGEDLEHFIGAACSFQLLLKQKGQLILDFGSVSIILLPCSIPHLFAIL